MAYFSRFVVLLNLSVMLSACASDSATHVSTNDSKTLRLELSTAMSRHRVLSYSETWDALSQIHEIAPGRIRLFYTRRIVDASDRASSENQSELEFWNREHLWPQSFGSRAYPAKTDLHHLVPTDQTVNSSRGNKYFDTGLEAHHECAQCWTSTEAWEPPDEVKGDIARMMFYIDVRYEGLLGDDVGDLALGETPDTSNNVYGKLSTLLRWHCTDPVSEDEVRRHQTAASIQGNRNVFVDSPELVSSIYNYVCL